MLSICITVKNRSRVEVDGRTLELFPRCVGSLASAVDAAVDCELVVCDFHSDDWPLHEWLAEAAGPIPVRIVQLDGQFSRGRGLNAAADAARGESLFFTDTDSLFSRELFDLAAGHLSNGRAFFPVLYSFSDPEHTAGWWRHTGYGNSILRRETFDRAGRWAEFARWGREDDCFFAAVSEVCEVVRAEVPGFFHQWHPEDILWKDRYGDRGDEEIAEIRRSRAAMETLAAIPNWSSLVLVDEARFGVSEIDGRRAHPFLEDGGEYAGPPADDKMAIQELELLRAKGADLVAFAWMSFWWLDHYHDFAAHLHAMYPMAVDDDSLKVFDLRRPAGR